MAYKCSQEDDQSAYTAFDLGDEIYDRLNELIRFKYNYTKYAVCIQIKATRMSQVDDQVLNRTKIIEQARN
jgi:hypothetical protein